MTATMTTPWTARVLTLFPEMFPGSLGHSLAGRALETGIWSLDVMNIRSFATDRHSTVDDAPFGGGSSMVMRPDVVDTALKAAKAKGNLPALYLSPRGRVLDQERAAALAAGSGVLLLCGRFEGVDQRVLDAHELEEMSIGDFVLSGGEPAALTLLDSCIRLLSGVVGNAQSVADDSFAEGLLEYPHYTRPQLWDGRAVPEVLVSGHHEKVRAWRLAQAEDITRRRRPDLWARYVERKQNASNSPKVANGSRPGSL
jgi:tRNA (guanine37-N1)-methyltransferase